MELLYSIEPNNAEIVQPFARALANNTVMTPLYMAYVSVSRRVMAGDYLPSAGAKTRRRKNLASPYVIPTIAVTISSTELKSQTRQNIFLSPSHKHPSCSVALGTPTASDALAYWLQERRLMYGNGEN
jgi:hypothetical protein